MGGILTLIALILLVTVFYVIYKKHKPLHYIDIISKAEKDKQPRIQPKRWPGEDDE